MALYDDACAQGRRLGISSSDQLDMPLIRTNLGGAPAKAAVVASFEHLATQCGLQITGTDGTKLFGGHSARVSGAQYLAAYGVPVETLRLLARHSGEAIRRYVGEAPLRSFQQDLARDSGKRVSSADLQSLKLKLSEMHAKLRAQDEAIQSLTTIGTRPQILTYVQNLHTLAVHGLRPGDGSTSICGWKVGPARVARGKVRFLNSITSEAWETLCERCLGPERVAARHFSSDVKTDIILDE